MGLGAGAAGGYNLAQALNGDPADLIEANEGGSALHRILNRDTADPLFPTGSRHTSQNNTNNIIREMREERLRRANPGVQSNLARGLFPTRQLGGVDEHSLDEIDQLLELEGDYVGFNSSNSNAHARGIGSGLGASGA